MAWKKWITKSSEAGVETITSATPKEQLLDMIYQLQRRTITNVTGDDHIRVQVSAGTVKLKWVDPTIESNGQAAPSTPGPSGVAMTDVYNAINEAVEKLRQEIKNEFAATRLKLLTLLNERLKGCVNNIGIVMYDSGASLTTEINWTTVGGGNYTRRDSVAGVECSAESPEE